MTPSNVTIWNYVVVVTELSNALMVMDTSDVTGVPYPSFTISTQNDDDIYMYVVL